MNRRLSENEGKDEMIGNDIARAVNNNWRVTRKYLLIGSTIPSYILLLAASLVLFSNTALAASGSVKSFMMNMKDKYERSTK